MTRRMVDRAFFESELVADWTMRQCLLIIGMIAIADDQGRLKGNSRWLKAKVFPYDDIAPDEIETDLQAISQKNDTIIIYDKGPRRFIQLSNWWEYQKLQWAKESKYPPPNDWKDRIRQMVYKPDRWVMTSNWGSSKDRTTFEEGKEGELLPNALGNALGISNTNTNTPSNSSLNSSSLGKTRKIPIPKEYEGIIKR